MKESESMNKEIDLGDGHTLQWARWAPDRDLNPQYDGIPDVEKYVALVTHPVPEGSKCIGLSGATIRSDIQRRIEPNKPVWDLVSEDPITLSPSLLCTECGDHGFVREGRWVRA